MKATVNRKVDAILRSWPGPKTTRAAYIEWLVDRATAEMAAESPAKPKPKRKKRTKKVGDIAGKGYVDEVGEQEAAVEEDEEE